MRYVSPQELIELDKELGESNFYHPKKDKTMSKEIENEINYLDESIDNSILAERLQEIKQAYADKKLKEYKDKVLFQLNSIGEVFHNGERFVVKNPKGIQKAIEIIKETEV